MKTLRISIVSLEGEIYSGESTRITVPAAQGDMGILPRHAPLLTRLRAGRVRIQVPSGDEEWVCISGGFLEVQPTEVSILADTALRSAHADEASAREAKRMAEQALQNAPLFGTSDRAYAELLSGIRQALEIHRSRRVPRRNSVDI